MLDRSHVRGILCLCVWRNEQYTGNGKARHQGGWTTSAVYQKVVFCYSDHWAWNLSRQENLHTKIYFSLKTAFMRELLVKSKWIESFKLLELV
ncbi:hypothetical protein AWC38_SpisGene1415 [Stylophora pistillata]|uniref:Uncharacterized protein n=1 Tax=Stylophora pistillata TaxID=50429 RepID=A0A2B4SYT2_STYPI|nr:hypothetical protein AWC38_SpisGene1415 [Stylophora pistillata]